MIGSVLVVDDSLTVRMDLCEALEAAGLGDHPAVLRATVLGMGARVGRVQHRLRRVIAAEAPPERPDARRVHLGVARGEFAQRRKSALGRRRARLQRSRQRRH